MRFVACSFLMLFSIWLNAAPVVQNTAQGIELRNSHVSFLLSTNAELISCINLETGQDIAVHEHSKIAYIKRQDGNTVFANHVSLVDNLLRFVFDNLTIKVAVLPYNDYFTVEVVDTVASCIESLTFIDLKMSYDFVNPQSFVVAGVAMSLQTDPVYYPSGEKQNVIGRCYSLTGCQGAKLAIIACQKERLRSIIKEIYETIPPGEIPINKLGGPYALDVDDNRDDCVLIRDVKPSDLQDLIEFYSQFGIKQFDFLQGSSNFIQGDFSFPATGSAEAFKQEITNPLKQAGISSFLHTYSFYISYQAGDILGNPQWQQQLEFREVFTLKGSLSPNDSSLDLMGDMSVIKDNSEFWSVRSPFMLIDNEIVKFSIGLNKITCQRGRCGTRASTHRAGAKVRIIGGKFSHIAPQIGSNLYYEVARRTAYAYNKGGFSGIYFDAFDGLVEHLNYAGLSDFKWYYGASFINEFLKNCEHPPIIEYSDMSVTVWSGRGRGVSWDTPSRGYKNFVDDHMRANMVYMDRFYVTTLGWYNFYPTNKDQPGNFSTKYMFFDDVDYLGAKAVAYDQTMVYNDLLEREVERLPALKRNLELYSKYNRLRQSGYFSDKVKSVLKEGKYEYKLVRKGSVWGFNEIVYNRAKLRDISKDVLNGNNPFKKQKPFVRLENMYSSDFSSSVPLLRYSESSDAFGQKCEMAFSPSLDLSKHMAILVTVKGMGQDSTEAICVRLCSAGSTGYADYVIRLNFDGWRDVVLPNLDNAEYPDLKFKGMEDNLYSMHRKDVDFSRVRSVQLFKTVGCKEVYIRKIEAVPLVENALYNPAIQFGSASVTFLDTLRSGEYIEYYAGGKTALIYDRVGDSRTVKVRRRGRFRVPNGSYHTTVSGDSELKGAPSEVVLTMGLFGQFIRN